ncbi:BON domain-containing protein [Dyella jejuensis]|uniref:BON domain-containing protein n=1 Tax=Dyella jejuensis TaxID=1432009 RepID=A0ABW8JIY6_9GAMM
MRNMSILRKSLFATGVMMAFAAAPFSLMAHSSAPQTAADQSSSSSSNETVPGKVDDSWITTKVKSKFAAAKGIKASDISVNTTDGVVTLTGTATSMREKNHAIHVAKNVKGVKSVDASGLTVNSSSSTPSSSSSAGQ